MDEETKELLGSVIVGQIENLKDLEPGSKEMSSAVHQLEILYRLRIDENKNELEYWEKREAREKEEELRKNEEELKQKQIANENLQWKIGLGVSTGLTLLGFVVYGHWYHKGLKFSEFNTVTDPMVKQISSKLLSLVKR